MSMELTLLMIKNVDVSFSLNFHWGNSSFCSFTPIFVMFLFFNGQTRFSKAR